jgi:adenylylsulfate kinase
MSADVLFLNGTVGAGKTSVAYAVGALLEASGVPHAVVDLDELRRGWPAPTEDPFNSGLANRNLAALVRNYEDTGAQIVVVAGVLETRAQMGELRSLLDAELWSCLLTVSAEENDRRLRARHASRDDELAWYRRRAPELAGILAASRLDDATVDTTGATVEQVGTTIVGMFRGRR